MTFGERLKYYRKQKGLSQNSLAKAIGKDAAQIRRYEKYDSMPNADIVFLLADNLNITVEELVFGKEKFSEIDLKLKENFRKLMSISEDKKKIALEFLHAFINQNIKK